MNAYTDPFLKLISDLRGKYEWSKADKDEIQKGIDRINEKQNNENLNLGVIGEFSSGKSTLINSLIRQKLLKTDADQGTTAAITMIRYGNELNLLAKNTSGTVMSYRNNRKELIQLCHLQERMDGSLFARLGRSIRESMQQQRKTERETAEIFDLLKTLTAQENISKNIKEIELTCPSKQLLQKLVIIDTPGIDSQNTRHSAVTVNATHDICDAAVVIVPADKPLSMLLKGFLQDNLRDILHRCIFVVTKIELIAREREQRRLVETIKARIISECEIQDPVVLPMPSLLLCEELIEKTDASELFENFEDEKKATLLDMYKNSEDAIYTIVQTQKQIIQLEIILTLLNELLQKITQRLTAMEHAYLVRHNALVENKITDLKEFTESFKGKYEQKLNDDLNGVRQRLMEKLKEMQDAAFKTADDRIWGAKRKGELKKYLSTDFGKLLKNVTLEVTDQVNAYSADLYPVGNKVLSEFETEFKRIYAKLSTLGGLITSGQRSEHSLQAVNQAAKSEKASIKRIVGKDESKQSLKALGGMAAGAAIGTAIFPGVGSLIGGIIGGFASMIFGPSLSDMKSKYSSEVDEKIDSMFTTIKNESNKHMDVICSEIKVELYRQIDNYMSRYGELVREMIKKDEEEKRELERKTGLIRKDLHLIDEAILKMNEKRKELKEMKILESA